MTQDHTIYLNKYEWNRPHKMTGCCSILSLTFALEFFFLEAGLLAPLPFLKPTFSSPKTRCCSSSDKL